MRAPRRDSKGSHGSTRRYRRNTQKTIRDGHESQRLHNRISDARTSKMIRELDEV